MTFNLQHLKDLVDSKQPSMSNLKKDYKVLEDSLEKGETVAPSAEKTKNSAVEIFKNAQWVALKSLVVLFGSYILCNIVQAYDLGTAYPALPLIIVGFGALYSVSCASLAAYKAYKLT